MDFRRSQYHYDKVNRNSRADSDCRGPRWNADRALTCAAGTLVVDRPTSASGPSNREFTSTRWHSQIKRSGDQASWIEAGSCKRERVDMFAEMTKSHELRVGDIVFGVDGVQKDEVANTAELFIKLRKTAGETLTLDVIRDGKRMQMKLKTYKMSFRK
jgi:hypothetical protein